MDATLLQNRDYTVIIAKTAIDHPAKPPGFAVRWTAAQSSVLALLQKCEEFDPDGITLYVSCRSMQENCPFQKYERINSAGLLQVLQNHLPPEQLNLNQVLQIALDDYFGRRAVGKTKPQGEIIIVLLDGEPHDRMAVAKSIKDATHQLGSETELGIGFIQIGEDMIAQGFLAALDDNLKVTGAKFDIVKTKSLNKIEPGSLAEFLLGTLSN